MHLRVGTRGSDLALTQTNMVIEALRVKHPGTTFETVQIKTSGDKKQGTERAKFGDKKDWVYELEMALLEKVVDIAVHSAKDVPGNTEPGLALLPVLSRATPLDIFIGKKDQNGQRLSFHSLPGDACIGTSSLRRKSALHMYAPSWKIIDHRGNVPTRIRKLDESNELSGIILAAAGVERLGALPADAFQTIDPTLMTPSANQGILVIQFREQDAETRSVIESISDTALQAVFWAERSCAHALEGDCNSAIGVYATINNDELLLTASVYNPHGEGKIQHQSKAGSEDAVRIGKAAAADLLSKGAGEYLKREPQLTELFSSDR